MGNQWRRAFRVSETNMAVVCAARTSGRAWRGVIRRQIDELGVLLLLQTKFGMTAGDMGQRGWLRPKMKVCEQSYRFIERLILTGQLPSDAR